MLCIYVINIHWPNPAKIETIDKHKVLLLLANSFTQEEWQGNSKETLPSFQFSNRIGGTIFGGGKDILLHLFSFTPFLI